MTSIFVGNLPYTTCESDLRRTFEPYGRVSSVRIMTDSATSRSRGFAFVQMPSLDDADEAIKCLSGFSLNGRRLTINESQNKPRDHRLGAPPSNAARDSALEMFDLMCAD